MCLRVCARIFLSAGFPRAEVIDTMWCWKLNQGPLEEPSVLLMAEPPLQPLNSDILKKKQWKIIKKKIHVSINSFFIFNFLMVNPLKRLQRMRDIMLSFLWNKTTCTLFLPVSSLSHHWAWFFFFFLTFSLTSKYLSPTDTQISEMHLYDDKVL